MNWLLNFLRSLFVRAPREFLMAVLKLIFLLLLFVVVLLLRLWEWLLDAIRSKNLYPEEEEDPCGRIPEAVIRRPDPAIYSQRLLQSQGLPVTWNNPDIWMARADTPGNIEPDSYHLEEDTDYIVSVQVHNAGTDAAIGVRVRLNYRPWSFNSPDLVPVETDAGGNEVVRFVNIAPLGSTITTFTWHTPSVPAGQPSRHFCLQASLYHPMDTNTANNMGQENTNVWQSDNPGTVRPGDTVTLDVPLFNFAERAQDFRFQALRYAIEADDQFELTLKTTRGYARRSRSQQVANFVPSLHPRQAIGGAAVSEARAARRTSIPFRDRFSFRTQPALVGVKNRYTGFDAIRDVLLDRDYTLPPGMNVTAGGQELDAGMRLPPKEETVVPFEVKIPDAARPGDSYPITLLARSEDEVLAGGVTVIFDVQEGG